MDGHSSVSDLLLSKYSLPIIARTFRTLNSESEIVKVMIKKYLKNLLYMGFLRITYSSIR